MGAIMAMDKSSITSQIDRNVKMSDVQGGVELVSWSLSGGAARQERHHHQQHHHYPWCVRMRM